jgi:hypothetical protein
MQLLNSISIQSNDDVPPVSELPPCALAWDPHTPSSFAAGLNRHLYIVDSRKMEVTQAIHEAHAGGIRYAKVYVSYGLYLTISDRYITEISITTLISR